MKILWQYFSILISYFLFYVSLILFYFLIHISFFFFFFFPFFLIHTHTLTFFFSLFPYFLFFPTTSSTHGPLLFFSLFPPFVFFPTTLHSRTFHTELSSFFLFLFLFSFFLSPFSLANSFASSFPSIPSKHTNFLGVLLIKTLPSKCIFQIILDINKIKKKDIQSNARWRGWRKKKKRMVWEWASGQRAQQRVPPVEF